MRHVVWVSSGAHIHQAGGGELISDTTYVLTYLLSVTVYARNIRKQELDPNADTIGRAQ